MVQKQPLVSIILPTYNRAQLISRAIRHILKQTYTNYELIIVDDGSVDDTEQIVQRFKDPHIRYIRREINAGGSTARNTGIQAAVGKYIAFHDSDDYWYPRKLELQITAMEASPPEVGVVYCEWVFKKEKQLFLHRYVKDTRREGNIHEVIDNFDFVIPTSVVLIKKSCLDTTGTFDERFRAQDDFDLWIRLAKFYHFRYIKTPLVVLEDTGTRRYKATVKSNFLLLQKYPELFKNRKIFLFNHYFQIAKFFYLEKRTQRKTWQLYFRYAVKTNPRNLYSIKIAVLYFGTYFIRTHTLLSLYHAFTKKITHPRLLWILRG